MSASTIKVRIAGREYAIDITHPALQRLGDVSNSTDDKQRKLIDVLQILFEACPAMRADADHIAKHGTEHEIGLVMHAIADGVSEVTGQN